LTGTKQPLARVCFANGSGASAVPAFQRLALVGAAAHGGVRAEPGDVGAQILFEPASRGMAF